MPGLTAFRGVARNLRNPAVDELLVTSAETQPRTGTTVETVLRASLAERLEVSVTLFPMRIENEILLGRDPATGLAVNRNADSPTRRVGSLYDGNDPNKDPYPKLPSHVVCDLAVRIPRGRRLWSAVAANRFNEV
jgi:hypothetical protein